MVITADEYKKKFKQTKMVEVDDGIEFEIRQISPIDLLELQKKGDIAIDDTVKVILLKGVVMPRLSMTDEEGAVNLKDIKTEHLVKLTRAIMIYSGLQDEEGNMKDFFSNAKKPSVSTE